ncbi:hypothetical protein JCM5350_005327 [Sporobolomyces pararoseus]
MSSYTHASCHNCINTSSSCDHLLPCTACISTSQACTYSPPTSSSASSTWRDVPPSSIQQWSEHPRLHRGSLGGGRLKPIRNESGEIDEFEWEQSVLQNQDLRLKPSEKLKKPRRLAPPSILLESESEYLDLVGDPTPHQPDSYLLNNLHSVLPDVPLHPTIFLNAHLASHPPLTKSRIAQDFEPNDLNRGNCVDSARLEGTEGTEMVVWRTGDTRFKRPTAVGCAILNPFRKLSRKGKEKAVDQDQNLMELDDDEMEDEAPSTGRGGGFHRFPHPIFTHHTPIQQLRLVPLPSSPSLLLGVRSLTSLDLVNLSLPTPFDPGKPPLITSHDTYTIPRSSIADFALGGKVQGYGETGQGLIVDVKGSLFGFQRELHQSGSLGNLVQFRKGVKKNDRDYSGFARAQYAGTGGVSSISSNLQTQVIVALEDQVLLYDLRSPTSSLHLIGEETLSRYLPFGVNAQPSRITSLLERTDSSTSPPWIHAICTTRDIIWCDQRMASEGKGSGRGSEVLRWSHERVGIEAKGVDRTLTITEVPRVNASSNFLDSREEERVQRIALSSRLNGRIEIYTVGLNEKTGPRSLLDPHDLPSPTDREGSGEFRRVGLSISTIRDLEEEESTSVNSDENMPVDASVGEEERRRQLFLNKMVKEAEAEERRRKAGDKLRFLEVGMDGELFEREIVRSKRSKDDEKEERDVDVREEEQREQQLLPIREYETVSLDMSAVREAIGQEHLVGKIEITEEVRETAIDLLKSAVEEAREVEGDVGALTALELCSLGRTNEVAVSPQTDSEDEDQNAQRNENSARIETLPRSSAFIPPRDSPLLSKADTRQLSTLDAFVSSSSTSAAASLRPFDALPSSRFHVFSPFPFSLQQFAISDRARQLRQTFSVTESDESPSSLACDRLASDLSLSFQILLPRPVEPDEPTDTPNQPQPATEEPPPLHLSYLRPIVSDSPNDEDSDGNDSNGPSSFSRFSQRGRKKKPTLNGRGTRLLLAEWHIGSDPRSYAWSNPYEGEKEKDDPYSQYSQSQSQTKRKGKKKRYEESQSQSIPTFSQSRFEFPSSFPSSSQPLFPSFGAPPTLNVVSEEPAPASSSQDWNSRYPQTQPTISVTRPESSSQITSGGGFFSGANSQVVPGVFGSRSGLGVVGRAKEKEKKKTKKRVSGF